FSADWHFTPEQAHALSDAAREVDIPVAHQLVDSAHGHDAFLVEPEKVGPPLRDFFADGLGGKAVSDTTRNAVEEATEAAQAPVHSSLFHG
ncbi:MAG: hypothetical protein J07HR59_00532, partial [Halorubrum sp. J07HR59]